MRTVYAPLTAMLLLSACNDRAAPMTRAAAPSNTDLPADIAGAPGMKERSPTKLLRQPALPLSRADRALPKNPFTILRGPEELERHWKLAGGTGAPPRVDFSRAAVIAVRLPVDTNPDQMAPQVYSIQEGTHILLRPGTPRELNSLPTDRVHYYQVATDAGPVASVQYPGT